MFRTDLAIECRGAAVDAVLRGVRGFGALRADPSIEAWQR